MSNEWTVEEERTIEISVNGEYFGEADGDEKLANVVKATAQSNGMRTVNVLVNGVPSSPSQGAKTLAELGATAIDIRTKDQRA